MQGLLDFLILYTQRYKKMKLEWQFQIKGWDDPTKRIYYFCCITFFFPQMCKTAFWMWDWSAFPAVLWTTRWVVTWRQGFTRLPLGGHHPLVIPHLCASPWIKFPAAARGKTGVRTEQRIVGDVVYLMRLEQRWNNKKWTETIKRQSLAGSLAQPVSQKIRRGLGTSTSGDLVFRKWHCTAAGGGKEGLQTLALSRNGEKTKGENQS